MDVEGEKRDGLVDRDDFFFDVKKCGVWKVCRVKKG